MIRTYTLGCCQNCGRDGDICEDTLLCRECLGIEAPSPPPGPPEEILGDLRPESRSAYLDWLMDETEDFDG